MLKIVYCCSLKLLGIFLFKFLTRDILIYTGKINLFSDVVCITDLMHAQYALLCDLFVSYRMKQTGLSQS